MFVGQAIFAVAKRQNVFLSSTARIQNERGHRVCDKGCTVWCAIPATWAC